MNSASGEWSPAPEKKENKKEEQESPSSSADTAQPVEFSL